MPAQSKEKDTKVKKRDAKAADKAKAKKSTKDSKAAPKGKSKTPSKSE